MTQNDLTRVHQRIAELEAMLREPGAPKSRVIWWPYLALAGLCLGSAALVAYLLPTKPRRIEEVTWIPTPEVVPDGALVLATNDAPSLLSLGEKSYAFVLGFRPGPDDSCVVAFDRRTWKVAWRSAPLYAEGIHRGRIAANGTSVAFAGAQDIVALDAATGERRFAEALGMRPASRVYWDPREPDWAVAGLGPRPHGLVDALNVVTGKKRTQSEETRVECPPDRTRTCTRELDEALAPAVRAALPGYAHAWTLQDGPSEIVIVGTTVGVGPGALEHALRLEGNEVAWHAPLAPKRNWKPWPNTVPEGKVALATDRILYSYVMPDGRQRITARDRKTGRLLYDEPIGGVGYGSDLGEFTADGDEAFLVANQSLIVLDASDGRIKKRITEF
ncbi:MAG: hypothetical protein U0270_14690 [Labilithrix sp.]